MLSRVADSLYWMSRYFERADQRRARAEGYLRPDFESGEIFHAKSAGFAPSRHSLPALLPNNG